MVRHDHVTDGAASKPAWEWDVTKPEGLEGDSLAVVRAEMEAAFAAARARVARRLEGRSGGGAASVSRARAKELLRQNRERVRALLGVETSPAAQEPATELEISVADLHTVDRLLSYVRHSVVRVCFYNLKLFCPSLVDEYDEHVKAQVLLNLDQLDAARGEIAEFFDAKLSGGATVGETLPEVRERTLERVGRLSELAARNRGRLDDEQARAALAAQAPALIDEVMAGLQEVQATLDGHKVAVGELVEQAIALAAPAAAEAGLKIEPRIGAAPRVFADAGGLLNCFTELAANAVKYSGADELVVEVSSLDKGGGWVEIAFADNGRGMTAGELESALTRGASSAGTGEGLPMIVQVVEGEHLGEFEFDAKPGGGCRAAIRLPVKLELRRENKQA